MKDFEKIVIINKKIEKIKFLLNNGLVYSKEEENNYKYILELEERFDSFKELCKIFHIE